MGKQTISIYNRGLGPLNINSVNILGENQDQFTIQDGSVVPDPVQPGEMATIDVRHLPTIQGSHSATLRIASNHPESPIDIPLIGTGI